MIVVHEPLFFEIDCSSIFARQQKQYQTAALAQLLLMNKKKKHIEFWLDGLSAALAQLVSATLG